MPDDQLEDIGPSPEHRVGAWVLLAVGVFGFVLGGFYWRSHIVDAYKVKAATFKTLAQVEQEKLDALKSKDSDADGINDFDESYVFKTSPYLADSDSDGVEDKAELEAGTDPNCPVGKNCGPAAGTETVVATSTAEAPPDDAAIKELLNPTPDKIREMLIATGLKRADLDKIDDETLQQLYAQALVEAQASKK